MKYIILVLFLWGSQAQAQTSTATVEVTANVLPNASTKVPTLQTLYDVNFVVYDENQTQILVDPIRNTVGTEEGAGAILILGTPDTEFRLRYTRFVELENLNNPANKLTVEYLISHNSEDSQDKSTYVLQNDLELKINKRGEYYLWVGGRINITNLKDGEYVGGLEVEILYDGN